MILPDDHDLDAHDETLRIFYSSTIEVLLEIERYLNDRERDALIDSMFRLAELNR